MNISEKRLLHRIYFLTEMVEEDLLFEAPELYWILLANKSDAREWRATDGRLKRLEEGSSDWLTSMVNTARTVDRSLSYLQSKKFISLVKEDKRYRISVTGKDKQGQALLSRINVASHFPIVTFPKLLTTNRRQPTGTGTLKSH